MGGTRRLRCRWSSTEMSTLGMWTQRGVCRGYKCVHQNCYPALGGGGAAVFRDGVCGTCCVHGQCVDMLKVENGIYANCGC